MDICIGCANHFSNTRNISKPDSPYRNDETNIRDCIVQIFNSNIQNLFLNSNVLNNICDDCLQQLENTYKFVQTVKCQNGSSVTDYHILNEKQQIKSMKQQDVKKNKKRKKLQYNNISASLHLQRKFRAILPKSESCSSEAQKTDKKGDQLEQRSNGTCIYKCFKREENILKYRTLKDIIKEHKTAEEYLLNSFVFVCQQCHLTFNNKVDLLDHKQLRHLDEKYLCYPCNNRTYSSKGFLLRHCIKKHNHNINYYCGYCKELTEFRNCIDLKEHMLENHINDSQQQQGIYATVNNNTKTSLIEDEDMDLEMHEEFLDEFLLAHTDGDSSFEFSECWADLDLHLPDMLQMCEDVPSTDQIENQIENFPCIECTMQFKQPRKLIEHLSTFHKNLYALKNDADSSKITCPYCNKTFKKLVQLKQHLRIVHTRNKRHICQLCDKQFSTIDHLKKHVLSLHQNERKYICHVCAKGFTQSCHLHQHLAVHTKMKNFQCNNCVSRFWRKIDLERHKKTKHNVSMQ